MCILLTIHEAKWPSERIKGAKRWNYAYQYRLDYHLLVGYSCDAYHLQYLTAIRRSHATNIGSLLCRCIRSLARSLSTSCGGRRIDNRKPDGSHCINFTGLHDNLSASLALKIVYALNSMENLLRSTVGSFPSSSGVCVPFFCCSFDFALCCGKCFKDFCT